LALAPSEKLVVDPCGLYAQVFDELPSEQDMFEPCGLYWYELQVAADALAGIANMATAAASVVPARRTRR
jgi:hypothetical protein